MSKNIILATGATGTKRSRLATLAIAIGGGNKGGNKGGNVKGIKTLTNILIPQTTIDVISQTKPVKIDVKQMGNIVKENEPIYVEELLVLLYQSGSSKDKKNIELYLSGQLSEEQLFALYGRQLPAKQGNSALVQQPYPVSENGVYNITSNKVALIMNNTPARKTVEKFV